jgi:hypothetical protein
VEAHSVVRRRCFHIFGQSAHRWRWGCQPHAPTALYPQEESWYSFLLRGWVDPRAPVRLEGLGQLKNSINSSGTEPAIYRLVAQRLPTRLQIKQFHSQVISEYFVVHHWQTCETAVHDAHSNKYTNWSYCYMQTKGTTVVRFCYLKQIPELPSHSTPHLSRKQILDLQVSQHWLWWGTTWCRDVMQA